LKTNNTGKRNQWQNSCYSFRLCIYSLTYLKLQVRVWTANPNQFVEDEDEKTFAYSVRISAQDLLLVSFFLQILCSLYG